MWLYTHAKVNKNFTLKRLTNSEKIKTGGANMYRGSYLVRIYLGCENPMKLDAFAVKKTAQNIVSKDFSGFTMYYGKGVWKNMEEAVIIFEILTDDIADVAKAKDVAARLKKHFLQESVLLTVDTVNSEFI